MLDSTQNNDGKKVSWMRFFVSIASILVLATLAWGALKAQVNYNGQEIEENKDSISQIGGKLDDIKETLNNPTYGLPVLNSRLDRLERDKR